MSDQVPPPGHPLYGLVTAIEAHNEVHEKIETAGRAAVDALVVEYHAFSATARDADNEIESGPPTLERLATCYARHWLAAKMAGTINKRAKGPNITEVTATMHEHRAACERLMQRMADAVGLSVAPKND